MRLIRPCKCSGSVSYVHLQCLNHWRMTSSSANYTCSICKYDYKIQKTIIADILMSENGAIITTILLLLLGIISMGLLIFNISNYYSFDLSGRIYHTIRIRPWWRSCDVSTSIFEVITVIAKKSKLQSENNDINILLLKIPVVSNIWNYYQEISLFLSEIIKTFRPPNIYHFLLCNTKASIIIDTILLGLTFFGLIGIISHLYSLYKQIEPQLRHGGLGAQHMQQFVVIGMSIASLGSESMFRFGLAGGCVIAAIEVRYSTTIR